MKIAAMIVLIATAASAQLIDPNGAWVDEAPDRIGATFNATLADALAAGYTVPTPEQVVAHEAKLSAEAQASADAAAQEQAALLAEIAPVASMMKFALVAQFGPNALASLPTVQQVTAHFYGKRVAGTLTSADAADWDILQSGYEFIAEKVPGGVAAIPWGSIQ